MHSTMTVSRRFVITSGILLLMSTLLAAIAITGFSSVSRNVHSLATDSIPGIVYASAIRADVNVLRGAYLQHIAETNDPTIAKLEEQIASTNAQLTVDMKGYEDAITSEEDRQNFARLGPEIEASTRAWDDKARPLSRLSKNVEAFQAFKTGVLPQMDLLRDQLDSMLVWNQKVSDKTIAATNTTLQRSRFSTVLMGLIALALGLGTSWFMVRALNRQLLTSISELSEGAAQIVAAAAQVSSSSQMLAQGSSEQAATIEETSSASTEINSMAQRTTDSSKATADLVARSQEGFAQTNTSLAEMVSAMDRIHASSQKISKILRVIDEIAFQTNILALNAAVEAARAGEAGAGFAVVADEVRSLAQRCSQAAKDTATLIDESIQNSETGRIKVDQVSVAIREVTEESAKIKILIDAINVGSTEQSRGIDQISRSIAQMEQVTQSNAACAEEGAASAEELNAQAETMNEIVGRLGAMVSGTERNAPPSYSGNPAGPRSLVAARA